MVVKLIGVRMMMMLIMLFLLSSVVRGLDVPGELCGNYKDWSRCVHVKEIDEATMKVKLMDTSDSKCFKYTAGSTDLEKIDCGAEALEFTWHQPSQDLFQAIGTTPSGLCLAPTKGSFNLLECGDETKENWKRKHFYPSWKSAYEFPCKEFSVSTKENALECACVPRSQQLHAQVDNQLKVYQHCFDGRIRGGLGAKVLFSIYPENICDGQPMPMNSLADWTDTSSMFVYWAEDSDDWSSAATHIEKIKFTGSEAKMVAHLKLPNCVHSSTLTKGKDGRLVVLCAEVAGWDSHLHLKLVEVEADLSKEVRRFSVLPQGCRTTGDCKGGYPKMKGADFRMVKYIPSRNWYVAHYNSQWGGHVADTISFWDADTEEKITSHGDGWACMGGHTETARIAYNEQVDELAVLCCADLGGKCTDPAKEKCDADAKWKNGMVFRNHLSRSAFVTLAPFYNVYNQAISGWLGDLLPCGDHFVTAWHGPSDLNTFSTETNNVGFMKISKDGVVMLKKWVVETPDLRERSVKLAKLGRGGNCDRFLLGWGDMSVKAYYPQRYWLVELDGDGNEITPRMDVTNATMWSEDAEWASLGNGDVAWAHTWKRNIDGTPNKVGETPYKVEVGKSCTWAGNGYGYTWGTLDDRPGGRFHTNEAFSTIYLSDPPPSTPAPDVVTESPMTTPTPTDVMTATDVPSLAPSTDAAASGTDTPMTYVTTVPATGTTGTPTTTGNTNTAAPSAVTIAPVGMTSVAPAASVTTAPSLATTEAPTGSTTATPNSGNTTTSTTSPTSVTDAPTTVMTPQPDVDECAAGSPCGTGQTCSDPDTSYGSQNDFVCTCNGDATIFKTDGPATCEKDECAVGDPCGTGQKCSDPNPSPQSLKDFTCTCDTDPSLTATGTAATCEEDECAMAPCGTGQSCNDPDTSYGSQNDFVCTCDSDTTISKIDGPATCEKDECTTNPCGAGQTCSDPNPSPKSLKDFTCTCNGNPSVKATGAAATCEADECTSSPCGMGQSCSDPDTSYGSQNDFVCTCDSDATIFKTDGPATCEKDECATNPCGAGQTCSDPNPSPKSLKDFICTCDGDASLTAIGTKIGSCTDDECAGTPAPCGAGQTCADPNTSRSSRFDFVCTCDSDPFVNAVGKAAVCELDECISSPCGAMQMCVDPDKRASALTDFECSCTGTGSSTSTTNTKKNVGGPATCAMGSSDECASDPCGVGQQCVDPDTTASSLSDYICTCMMGKGSATGQAATCEVNECDADPCGGGQSCVDPNKSVQSSNDFICNCDAPATGGTATGGPAMCEIDECAQQQQQQQQQQQPCGAGQTCIDADISASSVLDFTCTCSNGVSAKGGPATCEIDECASDPCGAGQTCEDPDRSYTSQHDFLCTCVIDTSLVQVDGPATCSKDECQSKPCGADQICNDPVHERFSLNDFTCTCSNGVSATGGPATCEIDECAVDPNPCGLVGQTCEDPNKSYKSQHDFRCSCDNDASLTQIDGPATCFKDECLMWPCGDDQTCNDPSQALTDLKDFTCTCGNGVTATGGKAICEVDECLGDPCGEGQTCEDPDKAYTTQHDFRCTCINDTSIVQVDGPAKCFKDECLAKPCGVDQVCWDPTHSRDNLGDYTCGCDNGVVATGHPAVCDTDSSSTDSSPPDMSTGGTDESSLGSGSKGGSGSGSGTEGSDTSHETDEASNGSSESSLSSSRGGSDPEGEEMSSRGSESTGESSPSSSSSRNGDDKESKKDSSNDSVSSSSSESEEKMKKKKKVTVTAQRGFKKDKFERLVTNLLGEGSEFEVIVTPNGNGGLKVETIFPEGKDGDADAEKLHREMSEREELFEEVGVVSGAAELNDVLTPDVDTNTTKSDDLNNSIWFWVLITIAIVGCLGGLTGMVVMRAKKAKSVRLRDFSHSAFGDQPLDTAENVEFTSV